MLCPSAVILPESLFHEALAVGVELAFEVLLQGVVNRVSVCHADTESDGNDCQRVGLKSRGELYIR
jgi:hypothetical protein